ncbi:MAG: TonB-dependent receptor, partial [Acidobacteriaceae bacterium]
ANGVATVALLSSPVIAADASSSGNLGNSSESLKPVIVTAERRATILENTPVAITALSGPQLRQSGITQLQDVAEVAPSVEMSQNYTTTIITIRGVSSRDTGTTADPAIAVSQDDFTIQRPYGLADEIYDLNRVEVIRGPQSTLYGRSATGGAINFVSNRPGDRFDDMASIEYGNYNTLITEGMLNIPLAETVDARAAFATDNHAGYRQNEGIGGATPGDDADAASGRVEFLFKPTERLHILLRADSTHEGGIGPTTEGFAPIRMVNGGIDYSYEPPLNPGGVPHGFPNQQLDMLLRSTQWNVSYEMPLATIQYIGGLRDTEYMNLRDLNGTDQDTYYFTYQEHPRDHSHELRVSSNGNGRLTWQGGVYDFQEFNNQYNTYQSYASVPTLFRQIGLTSQFVSSAAVYGQVGYKVMKDVTIEVGARDSSDTKTQKGSTVTPTGTNNDYGHISSNIRTYHAGIDWQFTPRNLLYAKYDTGFKPGGFGNVLTTFVSFGPEYVKAEELGSKNVILGGRGEVNLTAYHYDYTDQQVNEAVPSGPLAGFTVTANAGRSQYWGAEIEPVVRLTAADRLNASISWLHAYFTAFCSAYSANGGCTQSFVGRAPVQAPTVQVNAGYEHDFQLAGGAVLGARIQTHIETQSYLVVQDYVNSRIAPYTRSDAYLTYTSADGKWSVESYVRNLENAVVITAANTNFNYYSYALAPPRTYGVRLTYRAQ